MTEHNPASVADAAIADRFWEKVDQRGPDECWPWVAYIDPKGYGMFKAHGKMLRSHRVAYILTSGRPSDRLVIDHVCRNRSCCNPSHLRQVTVGQNNENLSGAYRNSRSGIRGVRRVGVNRWEARVTSRGRTWSSGRFASADEASEAAARVRRALMTHSEMDRL